MKKDKVILAAVLVLIVLVSCLLWLTLKKQQDISHAIEQINNTQYRPAEKVDYNRLQDIIKQQVSKSIKTIPSPTNGKNGQNGNNGVNGNDGVNGKDGQSVYQLWLDAGNVGTIKDFLNSLKGEKGDPGQVPLVRLNDGNVEMKLPTDLFWQIVPTCQENC